MLPQYEWSIHLSVLPLDQSKSRDCLISVSLGRAWHTITIDLAFEWLNVTRKALLFSEYHSHCWFWNSGGVLGVRCSLSPS